VRVELLASANGRVALPGHHRYYIYGGSGDWKKLPGEIPKREHPSQNNSEVTGILNIVPWYYHENAVVNVIDDCTRSWFRDFLNHGSIWTGASTNAVHQSQRLAVKPLKSSDWPSDPLGPSWPSFPSIGEWMGMLRRGVDPFERPELKTPVGESGFARSSRREVSENHFLATLIVSNVIVGVRSSVEIPTKFRGYFRYRQNFLILTVTYRLPIGLVRFLIGQWVKMPYSLWLRRAVSFKQYLKKVPISLVKRARLRFDSSRIVLDQARAGSCTPSDYGSSDFESDDSSMLD